MKSVFFIFFMILAIQSAKAFTLNSSYNSNLQGWANPQITLLVNTENCPANVDVAGIISDAVSVWNNIPTSSIEVTYGGSTTSTTSSSPPTVYCETNFQSVVGANPDYVPGAASVNGSSGRITRGILYLNASGGQANIANFDPTTLKIILAHEIGHILGLGHSASPNSLMYYDASARTTLSISPDDIDGISYLYPSDESSGSKMAGCGLVRNLKPPGPWNMFFLLFLLALPLMFNLLFFIKSKQRVSRVVGS